MCSLRDLPAELQAAGTLLTLDAIWRQVTDPAAAQRRLVVVDEAWQLMSQTCWGRELLYGEPGSAPLGSSARSWRSMSRP